MITFADKMDLITQYADGKVSKKHLYAFITGEDVVSNTKITSAIERAAKLRANKIRDRHLQVLYIAGESGSGKTTAAKYFAENKLHYDYFVTGSGEDFLDGYDKEECLILDDWRAGSMKFSEVLKMLDNNTNSSVRSRYNNKDLSNCKLIIITSIKKPTELYQMLQEEGSEEPAEQFYRRLLHHYFVVEKEGDRLIKEYSLKMKSLGCPTGRTLGSMNTIYKELDIDPNKCDDDFILEDCVQDLGDKFTEREDVF